MKAVLGAGEYCERGIEIYDKEKRRVERCIIMVQMNSMEEEESGCKLE